MKSKTLLLIAFCWFLNIIIFAKNVNLINMPISCVHQESTLINVLRNITEGRLVIPAIQRGFVWNDQQICKLFDSLLQDYPINTLMMWEINQQNYGCMDFYDFPSPCYSRGNVNLKKTSQSEATKYAIIDGQQRLTSLYIALCGSYNGKELYIRVNSYACRDNEQGVKYQLEFFNNAPNKNGEVWLRVKDVYFMLLSEGCYVPTQFAIQNGLLNVANPNDISEEYRIFNDIVTRLTAVLNTNKVIQYFNVGGASLDDVLDVFCRTNGGGKALSKGDLIIAALTVDWQATSVKEYVSEIIENIDKIGFTVTSDWVLRCCSVCVGGSYKNLKISNFNSIVPGDSQTVSSAILQNKDDLRDSIIKTFSIISDWGIFDTKALAKSAMVPMIYYIFKKRLWNANILNVTTNPHYDEYRNMQKYLFRSIARGIFTSHSDEFVENCIAQINANTGAKFPVKEIIDNCKNGSIDLNIPDSYIDDLLKTDYKTADGILNIIYSLGSDIGYNYDGNFYKSEKPSSTLKYNKDHIHPKRLFVNSTNPQYNTIVNLELLDATTNKSKNGVELATFCNGAANAQVFMSSHFFPFCITQQMLLNVSSIDSFFQEREKIIKDLLRDNL